MSNPLQTEPEIWWVIIVISFHASTLSLSKCFGSGYNIPDTAALGKFSWSKRAPVLLHENWQATPHLASPQSARKCPRWTGKLRSALPDLEMSIREVKASRHGNEPRSCISMHFITPINLLLVFK